MSSTSSLAIGCLAGFADAMSMSVEDTSITDITETGIVNVGADLQLRRSRIANVKSVDEGSGSDTSGDGVSSTHAVLGQSKTLIEASQVTLVERVGVFSYAGRVALVDSRINDNAIGLVAVQGGDLEVDSLTRFLNNFQDTQGDTGLSIPDIAIETPPVPEGLF